MRLFIITFNSSGNDDDDCLTLSVDKNEELMIDKWSTIKVESKGMIC